VSERGLAYLTFASDGREEWMMRIGATNGAPILFIPPLFEEMNRTRALLAATMRALAARGHGCWLPDLTGTGESERALGDVQWESWRHDVSAASTFIERESKLPPLVASLRGGTLIDDAAAAIGWWRLAPVTGASLARDMVRAGLAGVEWAGYAPSAELRGRLEDAAPVDQAPLRTARLASDAGAADVKLPGPALWRRSEPGNSAELVDAAAADIADWYATCAAS
jgi:alpha-beta hydrolase superfamily lysophospholipase